MRNRTFTLLAALVITASCLLATPSRQAVAQTASIKAVSSAVAAPAANPSKGLAALDATAKENKYLFLFFWKKDDESKRNMDQVVKGAMGKWADSADSINIQITDAKEKVVVDKFDVSRAPMPMVLAVAPNGAITLGLVLNFTEAKLKQAFVSPGTEECMKALQEKKLVLLCVQNGKTKHNKEATKGVNEFKADKRFAKVSQVVNIDPTDSAEASFLEGLKISPKTPEAVTVLLAPPGQPVAQFTGAVTKSQIVAKVTSSKSGPCAGGKCGPGGCP
jgi:hypothetical protein